jgi:hypothetical protein
MDTSWITLATGLVAGLGIGSVITAQIQHALKLKEAAHQSRREALEARYKVVILLMYAAIDFAGNETAMRIHRPDLKSQAMFWMTSGPSGLTCFSLPQRTRWISFEFSFLRQQATISRSAQLQCVST